jgi:hypothetical protein
MTYTFKLARRLAVSRDFAMLAIFAIVAACAGDTATAPESAESLPSQTAGLSVTPRAVTAEINQAVRFRGQSRSPRGDVIAVAWSSTGGSITAEGTFSSASSGTFKIVGRGRGWKNADTAVVIVVPPTPDIVRIEILPAAVALDTGASHTFSATASLADGSTATVGVNWTATGGDVDAAGTYTAGSSAGTYAVVAATTDGTLADTATVTVTAPATVPPPPPPPTLTSVYVTPASASLAAGGSRQFAAYGRDSAGDSIPVTVSFAATGGTVTSGGLYTAGSTGGTFRLVAREAGTGKADTSTVTVALTAPSTTAKGIPFGPFGLWNTYSSVKSGPVPFTTSQNASDPNGIVTQINSARSMGQKLVLAMTGGSHDQYITNGAFDFAKWKARMDRYNTTTIRNAVAAGVADGTIVGNALLDEPEHKSWGGVMTKPLLDEMAAYAKAYFPTLPMGVNHGPDGYYQWRPTERYRVVDYVLNQYAWRVTRGDVATWRDKVLAQAKLDGTTVGFSMNIYAGGVQDTDGTWDCTGAGQAGLGPYSPTCEMTATQVRDWGRALGPAGCVLLMWTYTSDFMADPNNIQAFKDVAAQLAAAPAKSCRRA